ncbi:MAG: hypothetical protein JF612_02855 [Planctomycetia bacterium]|nr:hypothetical protein [Planctomycetia bacterium]
MSSIPQTADSIDFHCTGCGRALKVPGSAAGKRASCPQCNTIVQVPLTSQVPPAAAMPSSDGSSRRGGREVPPPPNPAAVTLVMSPQPGVPPPQSLLTPLAQPPAVGAATLALPPTHLSPNQPAAAPTNPFHP